MSKNAAVQICMFCTYVCFAAGLFLILLFVHVYEWCLVERNSFWFGCCTASWCHLMWFLTCLNLSWGLGTSNISGCSPYSPRTDESMIYGLHTVWWYDDRTLKFALLQFLQYLTSLHIQHDHKHLSFLFKNCSQALTSADDCWSCIDESRCIHNRWTCKHNTHVSWLSFSERLTGNPLTEQAELLYPSVIVLSALPPGHLV